MVVRATAPPQRPHSQRCRDPGHHYANNIGANVLPRLFAGHASGTAGIFHLHFVLVDAKIERRGTTVSVPSRLRTRDQRVVEMVFRLRSDG